MQCVHFWRKDSNKLDGKLLRIVGSPIMRSTRENCTAISVSSKVSTENQQICQACKFSRSKNYSWTCNCEFSKPVYIVLVSGSRTGNTSLDSYIKINNGKFILLNRGHSINVADLIFNKMHQFLDFDTYGDRSSTFKMSTFVSGVSNGPLISVVLYKSGEIYSHGDILSNLLDPEETKAVKGKGRLIEFNWARCMECTTRITERSGGILTCQQGKFF